MMSNWSLGKKLIVSFLGVAAITLLVGAVGYYGSTEGEASVNEIGNVQLPSVANAQIIERTAENIRGTLRTLSIPGLDEEMRELQYDFITKARSEMDEAIKQYEALPHTAQEKKLWTEYQTAQANWRTENDKALELCEKYDKLQVADQNGLKINLATSRADHYDLARKTLDMLRTQEICDGGEDYTACTLGKWMTNFDVLNSDVRSNILGVAETHKQFHATIRNIKQLLQENKTAEAAALYEADRRRFTADHTRGHSRRRASWICLRAGIAFRCRRSAYRALVTSRA